MWEAVFLSVGAQDMDTSGYEVSEIKGSETFGQNFPAEGRCRLSTRD